ncbi:MAG: hypothetical protein Q9163_003651 [Psora crenata]
MDMPSTQCVLFNRDYQTPRLRTLVDINAPEYAYIDSGTAREVSMLLDIQPVLLDEPRTLLGYNDIGSTQRITHLLYADLNVRHHTEPRAPFLIGTFPQNPIILGYMWLRTDGAILDIRSHTMWMGNQVCAHQRPALPGNPATPPNEALPDDQPIPEHQALQDRVRYLLNQQRSLCDRLRRQVRSPPRDRLRQQVRSPLRYPRRHRDRRNQQRRREQQRRHGADNQSLPPNQATDDPGLQDRVRFLLNRQRPLQRNHLRNVLRNQVRIPGSSSGDAIDQNGSSMMP